MKHHASYLMVSFVAAVGLAGCGREPQPVAGGAAIAIDGDDIAGVVRSSAGPEAGVWVIAETKDLPTRFARIVVTDDAGRYLVPDLPPARYRVWVRGYGLADSAGVESEPGRHVDLDATVAPDAATAAKVYPAAYWYSMLKLPQPEEVAKLRGGLPEYLTWTKNMGCVGCHQLGQLSTRTFPPSLGKFASSHDAWIRRISSGQAGANMLQIAMGQLGGVPPKYLADWTDRIATGELPATQPQRPRGVERNVVATVRDWADETQLPARPLRHGSSRSDGERLRPAVRRAGAQHRRVPDARPAHQHRDDVPRAGARRGHAEHAR
jgi:hypothetical protein